MEQDRSAFQPPGHRCARREFFSHTYSAWVFLHREAPIFGLKKQFDFKKQWYVDKTIYASIKVINLFYSFYHRIITTF
jgi:hypothetical protein